MEPFFSNLSKNRVLGWKQVDQSLFVSVLCDGVLYILNIYIYIYTINMHCYLYIYIDIIILYVMLCYGIYYIILYMVYNLYIYIYNYIYNYIYILYSMYIIYMTICDK